MLRRS